MESYKELSNVFDLNQEESLKYKINNFDNIPKLLEIFKRNEESKKYPLNLEELSNAFSFLKLSFMTFRINISYFNKYSNYQIYEILIDFYLNNDYSSNELDDLCLNLIDTLINNIDISKSIIDSVIEKFAKFYYSLEEPTPKYEHFSKLLKILNHLYGINLNIKKPKHYYYFGGNEKYEKNYINVPLDEPNQTMAITLWFKVYDNKKGDIISLVNNKHNDVLKISVEENKLNLIYGKNNSIIKSDFYCNDYNNISLYYKPSKKKINVSLYLNEKQILKEHTINEIEENNVVSLLLIGRNMFGETTSILVTKNIIGFDDYKKLSLNFPFGLSIEKDVMNFSSDFSKIATMIRSIHVPYGGKYNLYNNQSKDLFFGELTGYNYYRSFQKKINLLGGINIILPIIELLYLNMKLCIEHKDLLYLFFELILTIIKYKKKNMDNAINQKFFMILSIFIEKIPEELFDNKIHQIIIDLAKNIFFYHNTCSLYLDYCDYLLLNEKIVFKFTASEQVKFWEQIYKYYEQSEKFSLPIDKLISILTCNDSKYSSGEEICCKTHYDCYLEEYKPTNSKIMDPNFNTKTENIFLLFKSIVLSDKNKEKNYKEMANILAFNNSPCLTLKILEFLMQQFSKKKSENKEQEKENKKLKDTIFNIFNSKEYKIILFNLLYSEFLDIKYSTINFIFMLYEYDKKKYTFSFKFIKENIFPKNTTVNFRYTNFTPLSEDTCSLAEHCINKIQKMSSINCYEHDNIICFSIFNFEYLSLYYTKFINFFIDFLNNNLEKYEEILDLLLYLCKNLNIEASTSLFTQLSLIIATNENLPIKVFTFIPLLNYILETMSYYYCYKNSVFQSTYNFLINIIISIKENKTKLFILEYIIKYYSLMKNKDIILSNTNLNNLISKTLTKLLTQVANEYLTTEFYEKNNEFVIDLTSILFDYIAIFNQDKKLYKVFTTNAKTNYIFSSYTGTSIICSFIPGLNIREYETGLKNPKLEMQWWDYEIVVKILYLFQKEFNISELYLKGKEIKTQLDKVLYIYDNLIYKDDINDKKLFKKKDLLYYVNNPNKDTPLIKIISYLYMLCLNMCKDENEYKTLLNQFIEYIEFIIVISTKIYSSSSQPEQNKKDLNHDTITFSLMFLFDAITQSNEFVSKNNIIKELIISSFNELLSICLFIYIERIPEVKTGIIKGMFKKMKSKIQKQLPLNQTPPYEIIYDFFIKDQKKEEEEKNILLVKNNVKNFTQFYLILTGSNKIQNNFNMNCQLYMSKHFANYINFDLIINLAKSRLIEDTTNDDFIQKEEKYNIDFDKIKTDILQIITKVKMSSSDYINYSYQTQRAKRNEYKSLKKELFIWNGPWSNKELFYKNKNRIKFKLYNHLTKSLLRPFLFPLLDLKYYTPIFTHFQVEKIFNNNELSVPIYKDLCLDIDKIINSYENKTEDYQYIDNSDEEELLQAKKYECCFVKPTHHIKGIFLCSKKGIQFKVFLNQKTLTNDINDTDTTRQEQDIDYDNIRHTCYGSYFVEHPKNKDNLYFNFSFEQIKYMFKRIYYYHQTGLEIYTINNKSYYFNFKNASVRNEIYDEIISHLHKYKISIDNIISKWKKYEISNMELLMWINIFGGRSYNDLSQYPVVPWVIGDYMRKELKEEDLNKDKNLYRDLSLPLGMIVTNDNGERKEGYIYNLKSTTKIKSTKAKNESGESDLFEKPYNYGTHYSNPFYVAHFLTRIYPFSYIMIELQGNKFDDPDRLFISMNNSYLGATTQKGDVRELIPEIYSIPEIYHNINNFDMGMRRNKTKVIDVECPVWSGNDPYKLISYLNLAFESDIVSSTIGGWIDLVFGYKQRGKEAINSNNVYMFNSYPDLVDIENMSLDKKKYYYRFVEFGSCPKQLFKKPFENKEIYNGYKQILDNSVSVITIELKNKNKSKEKKEGKSENIIQEETEDDIIEQIKQKTNVKQFFPLPKKGAKLLYANYTGIHLSQKKISEDTYQYEQNLILYGYGIQFEKYFIGNNRIMDEPPSVMYGKGRFLLEGGYLDGLMLLSDFDENKSEKLYNPNDKCPVTSIIMNKDENLAIVANNIGIIYVYDVKDKKWEFKKKVQYHSKAINYLFISDELNAFASCAKDNYVNIYSLPSCSLLHSVKVEEPDLVFLSGRPLSIFIVYSKKIKKLLTFGVNGHFIGDIEVENKPQYPFIYTSKSFRDYLIYSNRGIIIVRTLPYLEQLKTINLNGEKNLSINNLYLQFQRNANESERLYVLDQSKQILYIIGDSSIN